MTQYAKDYICENKCEETEAIDIRDAVIVDSINNIGLRNGIDFALYTCDLYDDKKFAKNVELNTLLTLMLNYYSSYIDEGIVSSITRNNHMNNLEKNQSISENDCTEILTDFMNYITYVNDIEKTFTMEELIQRKQILIDRSIENENESICR